MGLEVEVGAVGDALEFAELAAAETEAVLDVDGALRVVRQLLLRVLVVAQVLGVDAEVGVPVPALVDPVLVPLLVGARLDEELHLHLLELAGAEDEVARRDLVAEALAGLGDAERRLLAGVVEHVQEVDEDALGGLRTQVVQPLLVLDRAEVGLEQPGELLRLGPLAPGAAVRAGDLGQAVDRRAPLAWPRTPRRGGRRGSGGGSCRHSIERVGEGRDVAGCLPHLGRQDDRRVEPDDVVAAGDHRLPPLAADVLLELHAERPVVPGRPGAAVDLAGREDEPRGACRGRRRRRCDRRPLECSCNALLLAGLASPSVTDQT